MEDDDELPIPQQTDPALPQQTDPPLPQPTPPPPPPPTPSPNPPIKDLSSFPGFAVPPQSKVVMWPGGIFKTRLPWVSDPHNPEKNLLEDVR